MHHRYGRHGPNAWKRKQSHQFGKRLPVMVPKIAVVRVQVPISTERIIFIIMPDGEITSQGSYELPLDGNQTGHFPVVPSQITLYRGEQRQDQNVQNTLPPHIMKVLERTAERRALTDSLRIGDYAEEERYITIDSKRLGRRIRDFADEDIPNDLLQDDAVSGYEALFSVYEAIYQAQFEERTQRFAKWITTIKGQKEQQLRKLLSQDRQDVKTRSRGDWHARDLVMLRLLQVYYPGQVEQVGINALLNHHGLIDQYEKFVLDTDARNEVNWPPEDSFRS